jgi:hypothetical protein
LVKELCVSVVATNRRRRGLSLSVFLLLLPLLLPTPAHCQSLDPPLTPGTYSGLFYESNLVAQGHSGFITLTVTPVRHFTGSLLVGNERFTGQGQFAAAHPLTTSLWRHGSKILVVTLQPNPAPGADGLVGSVSSGLWTAEVCADRAVFNAKTNSAPSAGTYTLVIPGFQEGSAVPPIGDSCGALKVDAAGNVTFTGTLADGTVLVHKAPLSHRGEWPFYVSLYGGKGSVLSWLTFTNQPTDDVHGTLSWIRPPVPRHKPFPGTSAPDTFQAFGSRYTPPVGTNLMLQLTHGAMVFSGPTPSGAPFTNAISLGFRNQVANANTGNGKLRLALKLPTGAFNGMVTLPGSSARVAFKGVVLQKQNAGAGFFLHNGQSGRVCLGGRQENSGQNN